MTLESQKFSAASVGTGAGTAASGDYRADAGNLINSVGTSDSLSIDYWGNGVEVTEYVRSEILLADAVLPSAAFPPDDGALLPGDFPSDDELALRDDILTANSIFDFENDSMDFVLAGLSPASEASVQDAPETAAAAGCGDAFVTASPVADCGFDDAVLQAKILIETAC